MIVFYFFIGLMFSLFPALIILLYSYTSYLKVFEYKKKFAKLNCIISKIPNIKSFRLLLMIPIYLLALLVSIAACSGRTYVWINIIMILLVFISAIICEIFIQITTKKWGFYEEGIFISKGIFLFANIPEIKIVDNNSIEILNPLGFRQVLLVNNNAIQYVKDKFNINIGEKYKNENWNK